MQISRVRLHEHVALIAERFANGVTAEEFRAAAFPHSKTTRGSRRLLGELVKLGLLETSGAKYVPTEQAWRLRAGGDVDGQLDGQLDDDGGDDLDDGDDYDYDAVAYIDDARRAGAYVPTVPDNILPVRDGVGVMWLRGPDG
jgi:hypothetical protein